MKPVILITLLINLSFCFLSCQETSFDKDIYYLDDNGGGLRLTKLGCLTNGPWNFSNDRIYYNQKVILKNEIIIDEKKEIDSSIRNLVFELKKDGTMYYWFKHDMPIEMDTLGTSYGIKRTVKHDSSHKSLGKTVKIGLWVHNPIDSTIKLHFNSKTVKDLFFKYNTLHNGFCELQEFSQDSILINNKIQKVQIVNSYYYETIYPYF